MDAIVKAALKKWPTVPHCYGWLALDARGSAKPRLAEILLPALVLNARNDPFLPGAALPRPEQVGRHVTLWQPEHGGHVGFAGGRWPGELATLPEEVVGWLDRHR